MVRFADIDREFKLPEGTLDSLWAQESSRGSNRGSSTAGATGHFQFMKAAGSEMRALGLDPFSDNPEVAARAAATYLQRQVKMFDGDVAKGLAAYNAGGGNVQKAIKQGGENWLAHMPAETRKYVPSVLGRLGTDAQEVAGIADFSRRYDAGQTTDDENKRQARRNRELLEEGGIDTSNMTIDALLGKVFMQIFGGLIEGMLDKAQAVGAKLESQQGMDVADGTNVSPNAPPKVATAPGRTAPTPA